MTGGKMAVSRPLSRRVFTSPRGQKPLWLPNFTLTLLRTPHLPPSWAQFIVPLNINKLDIKDYLWNAYGIPVLSVRSYVQQQPISSTKSGAGRGLIRRWHRPRSTKKMTVEMGSREDGQGGKGGGIFVWPDPPSEEKDSDAYEPWDKKVFESVQKYQKEQQQSQDRERGGRVEGPGRDRIFEQAQRLLEGRDKWSSTYDDFRK